MSRKSAMWYKNKLVWKMLAQDVTHLLNILSSKEECDTSSFVVSKKLLLWVIKNAMLDFGNMIVDGMIFSET